MEMSAPGWKMMTNHRHLVFIFTTNLIKSTPTATKSFDLKILNNFFPV